MLINEKYGIRHVEEEFVRLLEGRSRSFQKCNLWGEGTFGEKEDGRIKFGTGTLHLLVERRHSGNLGNNCI